MLTAQLRAACPPKLRGSLVRYLAGEISSEMTLMQFALLLGGAGTLNAVLQNLVGAEPLAPGMADLARLAAANSGHLEQLTALAERELVDIPRAQSDGIAAIRNQFDRAVTVAPEASVALYSLGSANILARATGEVVSRLEEWRLLRPELRVLDIGCGIGRFELALAPHVGAMTAIDISAAMVKEARRRCRDLANDKFEQCNGRDLAAFGGRSFDLVLAIDTFPYLFAADPAIVSLHVRDVARCLQPGGNFVIINFSYRGDDAADRLDIERLASANGFSVMRAGTRDFSLWDGLTFLLTLPAPRE